MAPLLIELAAAIVGSIILLILLRFIRNRRTRREMVAAEGGETSGKACRAKLAHPCQAEFRRPHALCHRAIDKPAIVEGPFAGGRECMME